MTRRPSSPQGHLVVPPQTAAVPDSRDVDADWDDDPFERPTVIPPETKPSTGLSVSSAHLSAAQMQRAPTAKVPVVHMPMVQVPPATRSAPRPIDTWGGGYEATADDSSPQIEISGEPELELIMEGEDDEHDERSGEQLVVGWAARTTQPPAHDPFAPDLERLTPRPSGLLLEDRVVELFSSGEFESALSLATEILRTNPGAEVAREYADSCRSEIRAGLVARLSSVHHIPRLAVPLHAIPRATLDHRTGFLLSRVDGWSTLEDVLDISGMDSIDALRILCHLLDEGLIAMHVR